MEQLGKLYGRIVAGAVVLECAFKSALCHTLEGEDEEQVLFEIFRIGQLIYEVVPHYA